MPAKLTGYDKVINRCKKVGWTNYPEYQIDFDFDLLYKMVKYSDTKIRIGMTHSPRDWSEFYDLLLKYNTFKRGIYLQKFIFVYGVEHGKLIFDKYRQKQAYSNTFEYKQKKYGISEKDFEVYNKSRAVTIGNLTKKYGTELGSKKYKDYCDRQAYTNSEEYFGAERYAEVNTKKAHTIENYIKRYGEIEGISKLMQFYGKLSPNRSYSKSSQECFRKIETILADCENYHVYYATRNKEYCLVAENNIFLYDFVCPSLKLCIEYYGDHYHGNPKIYKPDDYLKGRGCTKIKAKEKWKIDNLKIDLLKKYRGYDTIIIWESDWNSSPDDIIIKLKDKFFNKQTTS